MQDFNRKKEIDGRASGRLRTRLCIEQNEKRERERERRRKANVDFVLQLWCARAVFSLNQHTVSERKTRQSRRLGFWLFLVILASSPALTDSGGRSVCLPKKQSVLDQVALVHRSVSTFRCSKTRMEQREKMFVSLSLPTGRQCYKWRWVRRVMIELKRRHDLDLDDTRADSHRSSHYMSATVVPLAWKRRKRANAHDSKKERRKAMTDRSHTRICRQTINDCSIEPIVISLKKQEE